MIKKKPRSLHFLSLKPVDVYLRGINKQPDEWQEVVQNNGEYTNSPENNSLLNYS